MTDDYLDRKEAEWQAKKFPPGWEDALDSVDARDIIHEWVYERKPRFAMEDMARAIADMCKGDVSPQCMRMLQGEYAHVYNFLCDQVENLVMLFASTYPEEFVTIGSWFTGEFDEIRAELAKEEFEA